MYVNRCSKNDVEYLRSLCIRHPDYKMTQLAKEMDPQAFISLIDRQLESLNVKK